MKPDRRHTDKDLYYFWETLNPAQQFSVIELQRFGYELMFVRQTADNSLAVLFNNSRMASVDQNGQIDIDPAIQLRH
ncbi:hypothetical protein QE250_00965 [Chromatiaceae bacterium AAb-1]|nr:hypothetical protein [Chromatiaceae bacterium AAb-1]